MKNYISTGERINVVAPSGGLTAGQPYLVGSKLVIVVSGGVEGATVSAMTEGVFELDKATGVIAIGQPLFWDAANEVVTTVAADNTLIGYAFKAALNADATAFVTLTGATALPEMPVIADSTASTVGALVTDFNALLAALQTAGIMASE